MRNGDDSGVGDGRRVVGPMNNAWIIRGRKIIEAAHMARCSVDAHLEEAVINVAADVYCAGLAKGIDDGIALAERVLALCTPVHRDGTPIGGIRVQRGQDLARRAIDEVKKACRNE